MKFHVSIGADQIEITGDDFVNAAEAIINAEIVSNPHNGRVITLEGGARVLVSPTGWFSPTKIEDFKGCFLGVTVVLKAQSEGYSTEVPEVYVNSPLWPIGSAASSLWDQISSYNWDNEGLDFLESATADETADLVELSERVLTARKEGSL